MLFTPSQSFQDIIWGKGFVIWCWRKLCTLNLLTVLLEAKTHCRILYALDKTHSVVSFWCLLLISPSGIILSYITTYPLQKNVHTETSAKVDNHKQRVGQTKNKRKMLRKDALAVTENLKEIQRGLCIQDERLCLCFNNNAMESMRMTVYTFCATTWPYLCYSRTLFVCVSDDIGKLIDSAKATVNAANNTVNDVTDRLNDISLAHIMLPNVSSNIGSVLDEVGNECKYSCQTHSTSILSWYWN